MADETFPATTTTDVGESTSTASGAGTSTPKKKGLGFRIGVGLLILYGLMWLSVVVVPFLPLSIGARAGLATGIGVSAEVILLIAIAFLGKETYQAIMAKFRRKKRGSAANATQPADGATDAADTRETEGAPAERSVGGAAAGVGDPEDTPAERPTSGADDA